jgi:hypothetical protein
VLFYRRFQGKDGGQIPRIPGDFTFLSPLGGFPALLCFALPCLALPCLALPCLADKMKMKMGTKLSLTRFVGIAKLAELSFFSANDRRRSTH